MKFVEQTRRASQHMRTSPVPNAYCVRARHYNYERNYEGANYKILT